MDIETWRMLGMGVEIKATISSPGRSRLEFSKSNQVATTHPQTLPASLASPVKHGTRFKNNRPKKKKKQARLEDAGSVQRKFQLAYEGLTHDNSLINPTC